MNTPPQSANIAPGPVWALLSPFGRIGREPYWLCFALVWVIIGIAIRIWFLSIPGIPNPEDVTPSAFAGSNPLFPLLFFVLQWFELAIVIKRFQDIGQSGFWALLIFLPGINLIVVLVLGFMPSQMQANKNGPLPNSYWRKS